MRASLFIAVVFSLLTYGSFGISSVKADSIDNGLAGKKFCRVIVANSGMKSESCLSFGETTANELDSSGGIPRTDTYYYSVGGDQVTLVSSESALKARTVTYTLSEDGNSLSLKEGQNTFTWTLVVDQPRGE